LPGISGKAKAQCLFLAQQLAQKLGRKKCKAAWPRPAGGNMFDDLVESSVVRKKTHKSWTIILSTIIQAMVLIVLILIPLIYTQALPKAMLTTLLIAPPPPPPPPPPPAEAPKIVKPVARLIQQ